MLESEINKYSIEINSESSIFNYILKFGATLTDFTKFSTCYIEKNSQCLCCKKNICSNGTTKYTQENYSVELRLPYGISCITYNENPIKIDYFSNKNNPVGTAYSVKILEYITIYSDISIEHLTDFILDARKHCEPKKEEQVICKVLKNTSWQTISKLPKRAKNTIFIDKKLKHDVFNDIKIFMESEKKYVEFGMPYKRNYLLEGPPGTGKTSLIFTIASEFNMDIAIISFGPKVDDTTFMTAISNLPNNSILLLEDIDSLFIDRKNSGENNSMVSFSGVLNVLDGIARKHKMITFMTTNYVNKLDSALKRPGRIDYIVHFNFATKGQIEEMFKTFYPNIDTVDKEIINKLLKLKITTSMLQKFLFENIDKQNIVDNIEELYKLCEENMNEEINLYT